MSQSGDNSDPIATRPGTATAVVDGGYSSPQPTGLSPVVSVWHTFLLRKAAQRATSMAEAVLGPLGLTLRHFGILSSVEAEPGLNQRVIGERLRIDRTTVVALIDDLERSGLLKRRRGADRRTFTLHLTDVGVVRLAEVKDLVTQMHAELLAPLSPAERAMLHDLLLKLVSG